MKKVGVLGLWHLGCVYSVCLAEQGYRVTGLDPDKKVIDNLQKGRPSLFEPGLEDLIKKHLGTNLFFSDFAEQSMTDKDYLFITLDTPVDERDKVLMNSFNSLVKKVEKYIQPNTTLIISSQVPIGTCRGIEKQLRTVGKSNPVLYFPENLRLGQAIEGFQNPDRIVLGGEKETRKQFLSDFSFQCPVLEMSLESAEMSKHALNSYLAIMISFSSEMGDLCERLGVNANDVVSALKSDQRVSPKAPLSPGIGFAGGTLGRDLQTLKMVSRRIRYTPKLIEAAYQVNSDRLPRLVENISSVLGTLKGKNVGLLGLTYKPNTNTLRRSQSLELADMLKKQGASIRAIDPVVDGSEKEIRSLEVVKQYGDFFKNLDAVVLMTWWSKFREINPHNFAVLVKNKVIFDTRNFLDRKAWGEAGFIYIGVGDGEEVVKAGK